MKAIQDLERLGYSFKLSQQTISYQQLTGSEATEAYNLAKLQEIKENKAEAILYLRWREQLENVVAIDIETTDLDPRKGNIRLVSLADVKHTAVYTDAEEVRTILADPSILKVFHIVAFDVFWLEEKGFAVNSYIDTMVMAQIVSNNQGSHKLGDLVRKELGIKMDKGLQQEANWAQELTLTYAHYLYSLCDAAVTRQLAIKLFQRIDRKGLFPVFQREMKALPAIVRLRRDGMPFSKTSWEGELESIKRRAEELEQEIKDKLKTEINLNSPKQLLECLKNRGLEINDTKDETLANHEIAYPVLKLLRLYREYCKISSLSGEKLLSHCRIDGRIYPNWRIIGAITGRMSCSKPNLQQTPRLLRPHFKASKNHVLVIADYSQIELRVIAEITKDPEMLAAFQEGVDLHKKTAEMILNKQEISAQDRQVAKAANFGLIYGMSTNGLQQQVKTQYGLEISSREASAFRNGFFKLYRRIKRYQEAQLAKPIITSLGGRMWDGIPSYPKAGWRNRYNYAVQGTASDGLKEALALLMISLEKKSHWKLCGVVHDEIILEVPKDEAETARKTLENAMIEGMSVLLKYAPVEVDVKVSTTWEK